MPSNSLPQPRKRPRQSRSLILVSAIREACLKILEGEGSDKLTTQRIADVAGVNIASVYQYFPNKEAVLADVYQQVLEKITAEAVENFTLIQALSRESIEATLTAIIDNEVAQIIQLYTLSPDFYRQYQQSLDVHNKVDELTQSLSNPSWETWFPTFLARHKNRLRSVDIDLLSIVARQALHGNLQAAVANNPDFLKTQAFKDELLILLLNYLLK